MYYRVFILIYWPDQSINLNEYCRSDHFRVLEFSRSLKFANFKFFVSNAIIMISFERFLNSPICPSRETREN